MSEPRMNYTADDFNADSHMSAEEALARLVAGNRSYVEALDHKRDLSPERIRDLFERGQQPFATVIACADSRAVSYTHLDVYKRQPIRFAINWIMAKWRSVRSAIRVPRLACFRPAYRLV